MPALRSEVQYLFARVQYTYTQNARLKVSTSKVSMFTRDENADYHSMTGGTQRTTNKNRKKHRLLWHKSLSFWNPLNGMWRRAISFTEIKHSVCTAAVEQKPLGSRPHTPTPAAAHPHRIAKKKDCYVAVGVTAQGNARMEMANWVKFLRAKEAALTRCPPSGSRSPRSGCHSLPARSQQ